MSVTEQRYQAVLGSAQRSKNRGLLSNGLGSRSHGVAATLCATRRVVRCVVVAAVYASRQVSR